MREFRPKGERSHGEGFLSRLALDEAAREAGMDAMGPRKWAFLPRLQSLESANPGATMSKLVSGMPAEERRGIPLWLCRLVISTIAGAMPLERFSVDVNRNSKGVPKGAQIRFELF